VRVFVTGGTGFVGSHLVDALIGRGDEVVCLVRDVRKIERVFPPERRPRFVGGSLNDDTALRAGCENVDAIIHVAGLIAARSRAEFFSVNAEGTQHLLTVATRSAPNLHRFVYLSSLAAVGPSPPGAPLTEDVIPHPVSAYGESKLAGEEAVKSGSLPWTIVRPPTVYGPRDREILRVFKLARRGVIPLVGSPDQQLSVIHVRDLASACIAALAPAAKDLTYFACHPEVVTTRQFAEAIHTAVRMAGQGRAGRERPMLIPIPSPLARVILAASGGLARAVGRATVLSGDKVAEFLADAWTCSPAALERDSGWRAEVPLSQGLQETACWYATSGWL
jgi:nucleoside-diphosphate-sugar epimerase